MQRPDLFQLSLRATEATSNIQDLHIEANFLLRQIKAYKCLNKTQVITKVSSVTGAISIIQQCVIEGNRNGS